MYTRVCKYYKHYIYVLIMSMYLTETSWDWPKKYDKIKAFAQTVEDTFSCSTNIDTFRRWFIDNMPSTFPVPDCNSNRSQFNAVLGTYIFCLHCYRWGQSPATEEELKRTKLVLPPTLFIAIERMTSQMGTAPHGTVYSFVMCGTVNDSNGKPLGRKWFMNTRKSVKAAAEEAFFMSVALTEYHGCRAVKTLILGDPTSKQDTDFILQEVEAMLRPFMNALAGKPQYAKVWPRHVQALSGLNVNGHEGPGGAQVVAISALDIIIGTWRQGESLVQMQEEVLDSRRKLTSEGRRLLTLCKHDDMKRWRHHPLLPKLHRILTTWRKIHNRVSQRYIDGNGTLENIVTASGGLEKVLAENSNKNMTVRGVFKKTMDDMIAATAPVEPKL
jgi:hypothetical protein